MHIRCPNECCTLVRQPYLIHHSNGDFKHKYRNGKSGVFFYDPSTRKTLIVQSRGMKWGPPKGSIEEYDGSIEDCAIREVLEETGICLTKEQLTVRYRIDRTIYFYIEIDEREIVEPEDVNSDISGIGWISVECAKEMYYRDQLCLNSHCKKLFKRFLNVNMKK